MLFVRFSWLECNLILRLEVHEMYSEIDSSRRWVYNEACFSGFKNLEHKRYRYNIDLIHNLLQA